jgi:ribosomal protein L7/L12
MDILIALLVGTLVLALIWRFVQARQMGAPAGASLPLPPVADSEAGVRELLARGERIAAIKLLMKIRSIDLKSAHDAVSELADNGRLPNAAPRPAPTTVATDPELRQYLETGEFLSAIKRYRDLTGCSLKEAKDAVEQLQAR